MGWRKRGEQSGKPMDAFILEDKIIYQGEIIGLLTFRAQDGGTLRRELIAEIITADSKHIEFFWIQIHLACVNRNVNVKLSSLKKAAFVNCCNC